MNKIILVSFVVFVAVQCQPLDIYQTESVISDNPVHKLIKRFISPSIASGSFVDGNISKIRAKRQSYGLEEECEKLDLCKLHARSNNNFFAAFELYFVNRENARLWDHHARSVNDCNRRYSCYR